MAFGEAWRRVVHRAGGSGGAFSRAALAAGGVALLALACWPLVTGEAIDSSIAYDRVPRAWKDAARDLDLELPRSSRAIVLPGQVFPYYRWGGTQDPILPALSERPVAVRYVVPYSDLHAADMLFATDALVQQGRALPAQLPRLLSLLGVGAVVTGTDDDRFLSGAVAPADAERALRRGGLGEPARRYGPERRFAEAGPLPEVRRADLPWSRPLVRVYPASPETVVDGSGEGVASLAALGALPTHTAVAYAGDLSVAELRAAARRGGDFVISDSNRRRIFVGSDPLPATGTTLAADVDFSQDAAVLNPFAGRGTAGQTVAEYPGARRVESPFSPHFRQFPEHRPFAAFDGDRHTWWKPDFHLENERRWLEITFDRPRPVSRVDVLPKQVNGARVTAIDIVGRRVGLHPGWNRIGLGLRQASALRVRIADVEGPEGEPGALAEVRVPGVHVRELLRPPQLVERALRGADLRHSALSYLFARATSDLPYDHPPAPGGEPEQSISRVIDPPAQRGYVLDAWVSRAAGARGSGAHGDRRGGTACEITVRAGGRLVRMRPVGGGSGPVRAEQCGPPVRLPARRVEVVTEPGRFRIDVLRLRSAPPAGRSAPVGGGRVLDPGEESRGSYDDVRLAVDGPSWLVLGESFNAGWKASCDGEDLGAPEPMDGYANGWRIDRGCRVVTFEFGPNRTARTSYAISALGCLGMLALVALPRRRRERSLAGHGSLAAAVEGRVETTAWAGSSDADAGSAPPFSPLRAGLAGLAVAVVCGFTFGLRAGVVLGPLVAMLLWRGVGARALCLAAAGLLVVVVPLLYLLMLPDRTGGGFNTDYAKDLVPPHWVTLAALALLALALWRTLVSRANRRSDARAPEPEAAAAERVPA
jgi:Alpha-(1->3)-arabinofuranosyltransferase